MTEEIEQPLPQGDPKDSNENLEDSSEAGSETESKKKDLKSMLKKLSKASSKTKLIVGLLIFAGFSVIFVLLATLMQGRPVETILEPKPTPIATQVVPTKAPPQRPQVVEEVLEGISDFDLIQQDLQPPTLDLDIGL